MRVVGMMGGGGGGGVAGRGGGGAVRWRREWVGPGLAVTHVGGGRCTTSIDSMMRDVCVPVCHHIKH